MTFLDDRVLAMLISGSNGMLQHDQHAGMKSRISSLRVQISGDRPTDSLKEPSFEE